MAEKNLTVTDIANRLEEAARTIKRLPPVIRKSHSSRWPKIIRDVYEKLNEEKLPPRLGPPTAAAISRLDEVLGWMFLLDDEDERRILWLRAERVYWKQICWRLGVGKTKAREMWRIALLKIYFQLNQDVKNS